MIGLQGDIWWRKATGRPPRTAFYPGLEITLYIVRAARGGAAAVAGILLGIEVLFLLRLYGIGYYAAGRPRINPRARRVGFCS